MITDALAVVCDRRPLFFNRFGATFLLQGRLRAPLQRQNRTFHKGLHREGRNGIKDSLGWHLYNPLKTKGNYDEQLPTISRGPVI